MLTYAFAQVGGVEIRQLCAEWLNMQHIFDGVDAAVVLESKVLVVQYHPLLALLAGEAFDVGEHTHRHHHHTAVGEIDSHHAALLPEVELLNPKVGVFIFAHNRLFYSFNLYLLAVEHLVDESVDFVPVLVDGFDYYLLLRGVEFRPRHLNLLCPILFNPYLGHRVASVRLLAAAPDDMHMPSVFVLVGREHREDKSEYQ